MQALRVQHYIRRATDFSRGMKLMRDDLDHLNSSALLAIHCAISYSDALRAGLSDEDLAAGDHNKAADSLQKLLPSTFQDRNGLDRLRKLLSKKTRVSYSDRPMSSTDFRELIYAAERFETWANKVGVELKLGGWKND